MPPPAPGTRRRRGPPAFRAVAVGIAVVAAVFAAFLVRSSPAPRRAVAAVSGRVLRADGSPAGGVLLDVRWARLRAGRPWTPTLSARAGPDGSFRIERPAAGPDVTVFAFDPATGASAARRAAVDRGVAQVGDLSLAPSVSVVGSVRAEEPIEASAAATVAFFVAGASEPFALDAARPTFQVRLPPGRYRVEPRDPRFEGGALEFEVAPDARFVGAGTLRATVSAFGRRFGKPLPSLRLADVHGRPAAFGAAEARGKWRLVEFWSAASEPSLRAVRDLVRFDREFREDADRFEVVAIHAGPLATGEDPAAAVDRLVRERWDGVAPEFRMLVDVDGSASSEFGARPLPTAFLVDPEGVVREGNESTLAIRLLESRPAVASLSELLARAERDDERLEAVERAKGLGARAEGYVFARAFEEAPTENARERLLERGPPRAPSSDELLEALAGPAGLGSKDPARRAKAATAVAATGHPAARLALLAASSDETDAAVGAALRSAVASIGSDASPR